MFNRFYTIWLKRFDVALIVIAFRLDFARLRHMKPEHSTDGAVSFEAPKPKVRKIICESGSIAPSHFSATQGSRKLRLYTSVKSTNHQRAIQEQVESSYKPSLEVLPADLQTWRKDKIRLQLTRLHIQWIRESWPDSSYLVFISWSSFNGFVGTIPKQLEHWDWHLKGAADTHTLCW